MSRWTKAEDKTLMDAIKKYTSLKDALSVAKEKTNRTERACRERYYTLKLHTENKEEVEQITTSEIVKSDISNEGYDIIDQLTNILTELSTVKNTSEELKVKLNDSDTNNFDLVVKNNQIQSDKEAAELKVYTMEKEFDKIHRKNASLEQNNKKLSELINGLTHELNTLRIENEKLQNEREEVKKENNLFATAFSKARDFLVGDNEKTRFKMDWNGNLERIKN